MSLVGMGFDSKREFAPPPILLGLLLCSWTQGNTPHSCSSAYRLAGFLTLGSHLLLANPVLCSHRLLLSFEFLRAFRQSPSSILAWSTPAPPQYFKGPVFSCSYSLRHIQSLAICIMASLTFINSTTLVIFFFFGAEWPEGSRSSTGIDPCLLQ